MNRRKTSLCSPRKTRFTTGWSLLTGLISLLMKMKIWIQSDGEVLFEISCNHFAIIMKGRYPYPSKNKRLRIKKADIISLASSLHTVFPTSNFISIYYTEEVKYWHELRRLVKIVCV